MSGDSISEMLRNGGAAPDPPFTTLEREVITHAALVLEDMETGREAVEEFDSWYAELMGAVADS